MSNEYIAVPIEEKHNTHHFCNRRQFITSSLAITGSLLLPIKAQCTEIREMSGTVFVNRKRAGISTPIHPGDNIVTSHDGRVTFAVGDDGFMVRQDTVLKLETDNNLLLTGLRLFTGGLLSVFGRGKDKKIITRTATIGIRGTALYLNVEPAKTYFCTCYGETMFTAGGERHEITSTHHDAHNIDFDETGVMSMKATEVIDHTDGELRQLESYFGRKPAFDM
ncbi:MAG: hypothetical protein V3R68_00050 [Gammaproteobacteria bacterium]